MNKKEEVKKYSNPKEAQRRIKQYLGDIKLFYSTRKDKKYMVKNPSGDWVHFGQLGYEDYLKHKDKMRRIMFRNRNKKWAAADKWSAAWLSYYILW